MPSRTDTVPYRTRHRTDTVPYRRSTDTVPYRARPCPSIPSRTVPYRADIVPYRTDTMPITYHERRCTGTVPCRTVLTHPVPHHIMPAPYCTIPTLCRHRTGRVWIPNCTQHRTIPYPIVYSRPVPYLTHAVPITYHGPHCTGNVLYHTDTVSAPHRHCIDTVLYKAWYHTVPYRTFSSCTISYHTIPYRHRTDTVSYRIDTIP